MSQPSPLHGARQHAQALAGSGDLGGARAVLEHAVGLGRSNLGDDDPEVLETSRQLAQVLLAADDPSGARRVLEEAHAAGLWRLGDHDPVMLLISHDLGIVAEELGNRHEARKAFTRVAADGPAALGPEHWAVQRAQAYLGVDPPTVRMELPPPASVPPPVQEPAYRDAPATAPLGSLPYAPPSFGPEQGHGPGPELRSRFTTGPGLGQPPSVGMPSTPYDPPPLRGGQQAPTEPVRAAPAGPVFPVQHIVSAPSAPVASSDAQRSAYARRAPALFAAIAAVLAAIIAVIALVVVLAQRGDDGSGSGSGGDNVPTLGGGPAPTDVRLQDKGTSISVDWSDPANGTVPFIVSGAPQGVPFRPFQRINPGETTYTVLGLNPDLNYCFAVVAVYSTTQFSTSPQVCTTRVTGTPSSSTTR